MNVSFVTAAETAQKQVTDGRIVSGHLGIVQGYLVYTFFVANPNNDTGHMVIVDAGNGSVLHTSEGFQLGAEGFMYRHGLGFGHDGMNFHHGYRNHGW